MTTWAEQELQSVDLGDARLNHRLMHMVERLADHPAESIPEVFHEWAEVKAVYRFWDSDRVHPEAIRSAHQEATVSRIAAQPTIVAIQDTTGLDFSKHTSVRGLGYLSRPYRHGLMVHSTLAATTDGVPLGVIDQAVWTRDESMLGMTANRRQETTSNKESAKWLNAYRSTSAQVPDSTSILTIADSEADVFAFLALPQRQGDQFLIRSAQNRALLGHDSLLGEYLRSHPIVACYSLWMRATSKRSSRCAHLTLRFAQVTLKPPRHHAPGEIHSPVPLYAVLAEEEAAPDSEEPLSWLLLTTRPVETTEQARECVHLYSLRWLIERYHYVLKSGCGIENLQLERAERIQRALATYSLVAWRLLWLTYEARRHPDESCQGALEPYE